MKIYRLGMTAITLAGLLLLPQLPVNAAPFTDHFDALIADLQDRASTLSNSTDKVQQKQFQTIQKVLGAFQASSTSEATDLKNFGKVAKTLAKSFPEDGTFTADLDAAAQGFGDDVQGDIDAVQTTLDGLGASSCTDKAESTLMTASNQLAQAAAATDFATTAKLLGSALKSTLKAGSSADKCTAGGGGGAAAVTANISGSISANFATIASVPPTFTLDTNTLVLTFNAGSPVLGGTAIGFSVNNVTAPGSYDLGLSGGVTRLTPAGEWVFGAGTVTFTTVDFPGKHLVGSFNFIATEQIVPAGTGSVTVTNGQFDITDVIIQ